MSKQLRYLHFGRVGAIPASQTTAHRVMSELLKDGLRHAATAALPTEAPLPPSMAQRIIESRRDASTTAPAPAPLSGKPPAPVRVVEKPVGYAAPVRPLADVVKSSR